MLSTPSQGQYVSFIQVASEVDYFEHWTNMGLDYLVSDDKCPHYAV